MKASFNVQISVKETGARGPQWSLESDITGEWTLADLLRYTKESLIQISREALKDEQTKGFEKDPIIRVDGRVNKSVENVNPLGTIEFIAKADIKEIVMDTYDAIEVRSPFDTGLYKESNFVFLNGRLIATNRQELLIWVQSNPNVSDKDLIRFINVIPYARKLERLGVTGKRIQARRTKSRDKKLRSGPTILAPNGAYFLASRSIQRKYKSNSRITFSFISGTDVGLVSVPTFTKSGQKLRRTYKKTGRSYFYPSIKILVSESGIK